MAPEERTPPGSTDPPPKTRSPLNGIWYTLLFSAISIFIIFRLSPGFSKNLGKIRWGYIAIGFAVQFLVWLAKAYRMFTIAQGMGEKVPFAEFVKIYLSTCFISHVTPFSSGGTPLQIYLLHRKGIALGTATAITAVDLGLNTTFFFILIPIAVFVNMNLVRGTLTGGVVWRIGIGVVVVFGLVVAIRRCFSYLLRRGWFRRARVFRKVRLFLSQKAWWRNLRQELSLFRESIMVLGRENPSSIGWAILATTIYWVFYLLLAPIVMWAIGSPASFFGLIGRQLLYNFAQILVPTPGGSGGSELILSYLFRSFTGPGLIGVFVFFWKLYTFYSSLLLGGFWFFRLTKGVVKKKKPSS